MMNLMNWLLVSLSRLTEQNTLDGTKTSPKRVLFCAGGALVTFSSVLSQSLLKRIYLAAYYPILLVFY